MANKDSKHVSEEEAREWDEARRRVGEELRNLEDRDFFDMVKRMAEENKRLRLADMKYSQNSVPLSAGDRARCPECNGTGEVTCHVCDGRGDYIGRDGRVVLDIHCHGKGRVRCRAYKCDNGYIRL